MRRNLVMSVVPLLSLPMLAFAQAGAAATARRTTPASSCRPGFARRSSPTRCGRAAHGRGAERRPLRLDAAAGRRRPRAARHEEDRPRRHAPAVLDRITRRAQVALFDGYLYTEAFPPRPARGANNAPARTRRPTISILRYPLKPGELTPSGPPDTIVSGLARRAGPHDAQLRDHARRRDVREHRIRDELVSGT